MFDSSSYLMHHGIKGMKWGVRRFQNEDGTRTEAGKRRGRSRDKNITNYKQRKSMTDEELLARIGRLQNEKKLMELERSTDDRAHSIARGILANSGKIAAGALVTAGMIYGGKQTIKLAANLLGKDGSQLVKDMFPKKK